MVSQHTIYNYHTQYSECRVMLVQAAIIMLQCRGSGVMLVQAAIIMLQCKGSDVKNINDGLQ